MHTRRETKSSTFGRFVFAILRVFAEALDGQVYHSRDRSGLECDAVVHLRNGSYGLIEIKLGGEKLIPEGATNLLDLSGRLTRTR